MPCHVANQLREAHGEHRQCLPGAVVEFTGNTPSFFILGLHQARHVLGNPNLLSCLFLIMNVETTANISLKRSIRRVARHRSIQYPAVFSRVMPHSVLHLKWTTSIEIANVNLQASVEVLWMHVLRPAIA